MAASEKRDKPGSSLLTVAIAFAANALVAAAKSVAAVITGSASMTAEAAHSWADTGNQVFLFVAQRRSRRPRDDSHPMGYGREAYVWSMFAAFGLFTAGAVVSIMHGIQQIITPEPASDFLVAYLVLAVAFVLQGVSFVQAFRQTRKMAQQLERNTLEQVLISSDPTLRAVFAEDAAFLIGLVVAFAGVFLHQITGSAVLDAVDLQGDHPEHQVAVALLRIERELEDHETVEEAVLTLATPDETAWPGDAGAAARV